MLDDYKVKVNSNEIIEKVNRENLYSNFVSSQEKGFLRFLKYTCSIIENLKEEKIISDETELRARIKSIESAISNYDKNKMLDDIFGIEIITKEQSDIEKIKDSLEETLKPQESRSKEIKKENGYIAWHESYSPKKDSFIVEDKYNLLADDIPAIEFQLKTHAVDEKPSASHHGYKNVDKELTQKVLEQNTLAVGVQIPRMWINTENGIRELTYKEIIKRIYPFVDITKIKDIEKQKE